MNVPQLDLQAQYVSLRDDLQRAQAIGATDNGRPRNSRAAVYPEQTEEQQVYIVESIKSFKN